MPEGQVMKLPDGSYQVQKLDMALTSTGVKIAIDVPPLSSSQLSAVMKGEEVWLKEKSNPNKWLTPISYEQTIVWSQKVQKSGDLVTMRVVERVEKSLRDNYFFLFQGISIALLFLTFAILRWSKLVIAATAVTTTFSFFAFASALSAATPHSLAIFAAIAIVMVAMIIGVSSSFIAFMAALHREMEAIKICLAVAVYSSSTSFVLGYFFI
jgi:hypothetical protein